MKYKTRDIIEYIVALVNEFAVAFHLTEKQAYHYIRLHGGIGFIESNYGVMHTFDFREAVDSVALFCRRNGGEI